MNKDSWERRLAVAWSSLDDVGGAEFVELIGSLAAELPAGSARADFEQACAFDSTGHPEKAVPLYQAALAKGDGLTDEQRRRSVIQMASSVRNLGRPDESVRLLRTELARGSDHLDDAVRATLALALTDLGQTREAVSIAVGALARHLPRYQRSMAAYAQMLMEPEPPAPTR